jgi:predicted membrane protein
MLPSKIISVFKESETGGVVPHSKKELSTREVNIMTVLVGGGVAVLLGIIGLFAWWREFFTILKGAIPLVLLLGGALAIYVGMDELKEKIQEEREKEKEELNKTREELEKAKAEAEKMKEELEKMKGGPSPQ